MIKNESGTTFLYAFTWTYNNVITQENLNRLTQVHQLLVITVDLANMTFLYLSFFFKS